MVLAIADPTWGDLAAWVGVLFVLVAAIYARQQLKEAQQLRRDQLRPYVFVDIEPNEATFEFLDIVVGNAGPVGAYDISLEFDPPLVSTLDEHAGCENHRPIAQQLMFDRDVLTLPPGKTMRTLFEKNASRQASDLPTSHRVIIRYYGTPTPINDAGKVVPRPRTDHQWVDALLLDLETYQDLHYVEVKERTRSSSGATRSVRSGLG
jgi:hypothetical protein